MEPDHEKELQDIIGSLACPKDFKCYKSGFETLCKAKDIGLYSILECLEEDSALCLFSINVHDAYYCECPLRIYIAKRLKK